MCTALIMAGGRAVRMRSSGVDQHKALACVLGIPIIERNLMNLLDQGFRDVIIAVNREETGVIDYVLTRGKDLVDAVGASLQCYQETVSLGTIGAAGAVRCPSESLLVVNVDNLTTLDLRAFVVHHQTSGAALTIAAHVENFRIPFGQLVVEHGYVTEYKEKPTFPVQLSSGTYVLSSEARRCIRSDRRTDIPELFAFLKRTGRTVSAYAHSEIWIDVNDCSDLRRAEELITRYQEGFSFRRKSSDRAPRAKAIEGTQSLGSS